MSRFFSNPILVIGFYLAIDAAFVAVAVADAFLGFLPTETAEMLPAVILAIGLFGACVEMPMAHFRASATGENR